MITPAKNKDRVFVKVKGLGWFFASSLSHAPVASRCFLAWCFNLKDFDQIIGLWPICISVKWLLAKIATLGSVLALFDFGCGSWRDQNTESFSWTETQCYAHYKLFWTSKSCKVKMTQQMIIPLTQRCFTLSTYLHGWNQRSAQVSGVKTR